MERAQYNRHSQARVAETAKGASRRATPDAPEHIDHGGAAPDTIIGRADAERERVPTAPQVRKTRRNAHRRIARERVPTNLTFGAGSRRSAAPTAATAQTIPFSSQPSSPLRTRSASFLPRKSTLCLTLQNRRSMRNRAAQQK